MHRPLDSPWGPLGDQDDVSLDLLPWDVGPGLDRDDLAALTRGLRGVGVGVLDRVGALEAGEVLVLLEGLAEDAAAGGHPERPTGAWCRVVGEVVRQDHRLDARRLDALDALAEVVGGEMTPEGQGWLARRMAAVLDAVWVAHLCVAVRALGETLPARLEAALGEAWGVFGPSGGDPGLGSVGAGVLAGALADWAIAASGGSALEARVALVDGVLAAARRAPAVSARTWQARLHALDRWLATRVARGPTHEAWAVIETLLHQVGDLVDVAGAGDARWDEVRARLWRTSASPLGIAARAAGLVPGVSPSEAGPSFDEPWLCLRRVQEALQPAPAVWRALTVTVAAVSSGLAEESVAGVAALASRGVGSAARAEHARALTHAARTAATALGAQGAHGATLARLAGVAAGLEAASTLHLELPVVLERALAAPGRPPGAAAEVFLRAAMEVTVRGLSGGATAAPALAPPWPGPESPRERRALVAGCAAALGDALCAVLPPGAARLAWDWVRSLLADAVGEAQGAVLRLEPRRLRLLPAIPGPRRGGLAGEVRRLAGDVDRALRDAGVDTLARRVVLDVWYLLEGCGQGPVGDDALDGALVRALHERLPGTDAAQLGRALRALQRALPGVAPAAVAVRLHDPLDRALAALEQALVASVVRQVTGPAWVGALADDLASLPAAEVALRHVWRLFARPPDDPIGELARVEDAILDAIGPAAPAARAWAAWRELLLDLHGAAEEGRAAARALWRGPRPGETADAAERERREVAATLLCAAALPGAGRVDRRAAVARLVERGDPLVEGASWTWAAATAALLPWLVELVDGGGISGLFELARLLPAAVSRQEALAGLPEEDRRVLHAAGRVDGQRRWRAHRLGRLLEHRPVPAAVEGAVEAVLGWPVGFEDGCLRGLLVLGRVDVGGPGPARYAAWLACLDQALGPGRRDALAAHLADADLDPGSIPQWRADVVALARRRFGLGSPIRDALAQVGA